MKCFSCDFLFCFHKKHGFPFRGGTYLLLRNLCLSERENDFSTQIFFFFTKHIFDSRGGIDFLLREAIFLSEVTFLFVNMCFPRRHIFASTRSTIVLLRKGNLFQDFIFVLPREVRICISWRHTYVLLEKGKILLRSHLISCKHKYLHFPQ